MELRIPVKLIATAFSKKKTKLLWFFCMAKGTGHRVEIDHIISSLGVTRKTGKRWIKGILNEGWASSDGKFLFLRSWRSIGFNKKGGGYICRDFKDYKEFSALCLAFKLSATYRSRNSLRSNKRRALQKNLPATYLAKACGLTQRTFERLKASAVNWKFLTSERQFVILGSDKDYDSIKKHTKDITVFRMGKLTVSPVASKIVIKI